jgi:hypothetical protein
MKSCSASFLVTVKNPVLDGMLTCAVERESCSVDDRLVHDGSNAGPDL